MVIYSHSRISTFEQCPLRFKFQYIDRLEPEIKETIEGFLGKKVHETLEWVYREAMQGRVHELDDIIRFYLELWNKDFSEEVKANGEQNDPAFYFHKGIRFLVDYFVNNYPFTDNTIALEKKLVFSLDENNQYQLQGYIDRLVHNKETNTFEIHDYKTGSIKSQEELDKDRQLALYSLGIKQEFGKQANVDLIWHFLDFNKKMLSKRTDEQLELLRQELIETIKKIESAKEFPACPGPLCRWCGFRKYCGVFD